VAADELASGEKASWMLWGDRELALGRCNIAKDDVRLVTCSKGRCEAERGVNREV
jgi:hypothetical protein